MCARKQMSDEKNFALRADRSKLALCDTLDSCG